LDAASLGAVLRERLTSEPGRAAALLRAEMYRLLRLDEPAEPPLLDPVPLPQIVSGRLSGWESER
ncbi:hypothetical protein ACFQ07_25800, partial [Actinomadura adrarensis]